MIGIDPGINFTGVAILDDSGRATAVNLIERKYFKLAENMQQQAAELREFLYLGYALSVVELPRIYPHKPQRANDQMDLAFMAGGLLSAASMRSIQVKIATPHEWKGTTPKNIHNRRVLREVKNLEALLEPYKKTTHEHIIDAAGLALWALGKGA